MRHHHRMGMGCGSRDEAGCRVDEQSQGCGERGAERRGCSEHRHGFDDNARGCGGRGHGGGRRQRFFGHGELRLVILDILTRNASHGYELIKAIESLTQGHYTPSPGVIYPTLELLQDQGLITIELEDGGRKNIAITDDGRRYQEEHQQQLGHIQQRLQARMVGHALCQDPQMKRALDNFKAVLDLKVNQQPLSDAQLKQIIGVIDRASLEISQLD